MPGWDGFFAAQLGGSAGLAGLVMVGASINLKTIMASPRLPNRLLEALLMMLAVLVISSIFLVPRQGPRLVGGEVLAAALALWAAESLIHYRNLRDAEPELRRAALMMAVLAQLATAPLLAAAVLLLRLQTVGAYWIVPGVLLAYVIVFVNAWVLLVEINR